jgi:hypothetical protein
MSDHGSFEELAALYALDALDGADLVTYEIHRRDCLPCRRAEADFARVTAGLAPADPAPESLKARVDAALPRKESGRSNIVTALAMAAVLMIAVGLFLQSRHYANLWVEAQTQLSFSETNRKLAQEQLENVIRQLVTTRRDRDELDHMAVLAAKGRYVALAAAKPGIDGSAVVFWDGEGKGVVFVPRGMKPLPPGKHYVLWAVMEKPVAVADVMTGKMYGMAPVMAAPMAGGAKAFAISIEDSNRPDSPTADQVVMAGAVKVE